MEKDEIVKEMNKTEELFKEKFNLRRFHLVRKPLVRNNKFEFAYNFDFMLNGYKEAEEKLKKLENDYFGNTFGATKWFMSDGKIPVFYSRDYLIGDYECVLKEINRLLCYFHGFDSKCQENKLPIKEVLQKVDRVQEIKELLNKIDSMERNEGEKTYLSILEGLNGI